MSLDRDEANPGYRLGRLFAVLENVQRTALGRSVNATIRDRYYGAASATPASVFPLLIRNANHHLANIRKAEQAAGSPTPFEKEMGQIIDGLGADASRGNLRLEDRAASPSATTTSASAGSPACRAEEPADNDRHCRHRRN